MNDSLKRLLKNYAKLSENRYRNAHVSPGEAIEMGNRILQLGRQLEKAEQRNQELMKALEMACENAKEDDPDVWSEIERIVEGNRD